MILPRFCVHRLLMLQKYLIILKFGITEKDYILHLIL